MIRPDGVVCRLWKGVGKNMSLEKQRALQWNEKDAYLETYNIIMYTAVVRFPSICAGDVWDISYEIMHETHVDNIFTAVLVVVQFVQSYRNENW